MSRVEPTRPAIPAYQREMLRLLRAESGPLRAVMNQERHRGFDEWCRRTVRENKKLEVAAKTSQVDNS